MQISSKCYYALRSLYELASRHGEPRPVRIALIAARQQIPRRFLEVILSELRQGGFVESRRGVDGGYFLARPPEAITLGEIVRFVDGDIAPVSCVSSREGDASCDLNFQCPFHDFWGRVLEALSALYDHTSLADIVEGWRRKSRENVLHYDI